MNNRTGDVLNTTFSFIDAYDIYLTANDIAKNGVSWDTPIVVMAAAMPIIPGKIASDLPQISRQKLKC